MTPADRAKPRRLTPKEIDALCLLYNVSRLDPHAWVSWHPSRYLAQLRNLNHMGLAKLNHFVGYRITLKGIRKAEKL